MPSPIHLLHPPVQAIAFIYRSWLKGTSLNYDTKKIQTHTLPINPRLAVSFGKYSLDVNVERNWTRVDHAASDMVAWCMSPEETFCLCSFSSGLYPSLPAFLEQGHAVGCLWYSGCINLNHNIGCSSRKHMYTYSVKGPMLGSVKDLF